ncbi:carboxymuconolactone decarboxylase family protein [Kocuria palustris]|uniref:carboxymuconolactone decarboxylase family protein n=1 Tax=Kocuria palustris TaxID=71999 RepID=UPI0021B41231|nr:carboxymuconolactone decarboxylase family protein [Kocuria palustris]
MRVRREVLSDAHVDRSEARKDDFTAEWQDFISRYAWGEIWTRPGLDRPMRSAITLTALIAAGHWGEFEMHVGAALRNGLTREQIKEILLQSAIYLSVPSANNAFSHAKAVFDRLDEQDAESAHGTPTDDNDHENDEGVSS